MRRPLLRVFVIVAATWLVVFASGYGVLNSRATLHVGNAQGGTVTCRYLYAAGLHEQIAFTPDIEAFVCPRFISVRAPTPADEVHWAAALPTDRLVQLECRFLRYPVDGDNGLGIRFTVDAPLRISVNFTTGEFRLLDAADQASLGPPQPDASLGPNKTAVMSMQFDRGTLPIFSGDHPGSLRLLMFSSDGQASMFLRPPQGPLLWSRQGGCRPTETRTSL